MDARIKTADQQADAVREEILRHAHDLFCHYGFNKTSIGDIAKCCGMSAGNLYRYYRNKQAIGLAAVDNYFRAVEDAMRNAVAEETGSSEARIRAALRTCVEHLVVEFERNAKLVELADFLCGDEEGLVILDRHIQVKRETIAAEIARGISDGSLRDCDPEATSATMLTALKVFWTPMTLVVWRDPSTIMTELEDLLDLLFRGMRS